MSLSKAETQKNTFAETIYTRSNILKTDIQLAAYNQTNGKLNSHSYGNMISIMINFFQKHLLHADI